MLATKLWVKCPVTLYLGSAASTSVSPERMWLAFLVFGRYKKVLELPTTSSNEVSTPWNQHSYAAP
jgi:hypothetical protein